MAADWQTDTVIDALRTTIGTSVTVAGATVNIRRKPETDLYALPTVNSANYPLIAIEDVGEEPADDEKWGTIKQQAVTVTVNLHFVCRDEDVDGSSLTSPVEFCRQSVEAICEKIGKAPELGSTAICEGRWEGNGEDLETKDRIRSQGLCERGAVWSFVYLHDRP
ncbi:MAG TPA: hypothetical protein VM223_23825 [Planctomycetota bacterium]|nr:hypothetical protein [Planctomycetota bacterium]